MFCRNLKNNFLKNNTILLNLAKSFAEFAKKQKTEKKVKTNKNTKKTFVQKKETINSTNINANKNSTINKPKSNKNFQKFLLDFGYVESVGSVLL